MNREQLRETIDAALDIPMSILALVALILILIDLTTTISPAWRVRLDVVYWVTWSAFALEYLVKLLLSDDKRRYVSTHWIEMAIIAVPFLRILRVLRVVRLTRSVAALRLLLFASSSVSGLAAVLTRQIVYLSVTTIVVVLVAATGAYILERGSALPGRNIMTFADALWWTSTTVTTISAEKFPVTFGGRVIGVLIRLYAMVVFTFLTGAIAAFLIEERRRERQNES